MDKQKLSIPNISCHHCVNTIKNELVEIDGVKSVEGDPVAREITIQYEAPATLDQIRDMLKEINYPAE